MFWWYYDRDHGMSHYHTEKKSMGSRTKEVFDWSDVWVTIMNHNRNQLLIWLIMQKLLLTNSLSVSEL